MRLLPLLVTVMASHGITALAQGYVVDVDAPMSHLEYQVSQTVEVGYFPCSHGRQVLLEHDPHAPGMFKMQFGRNTFRLRPVTTSTGAVRLEDSRQQMVWIQLGNKSMLFDHGAQSRVADECLSPSQAAQIAYEKVYPPQSLLGGYSGD